MLQGAWEGKNQEGIVWRGWLLSCCYKFHRWWGCWVGQIWYQGRPTPGIEHSWLMMLLLKQAPGGEFNGVCQHCHQNQNKVKSRHGKAAPKNREVDPWLTDWPYKHGPSGCSNFRTLLDVWLASYIPLFTGAWLKSWFDSHVKDFFQIKV